VYFAPLPYVRKADNADNDEKINQQNVESFSRTGVVHELTRLQVV